MAIMADDYYNTFDYYNAEPPRESVAPPPDEAAATAPEDEFNEQVHGSEGKRGRSVSLVAMLAISGLAVSFMFPGIGSLLSSEKMTEASTYIETSVTGNGTGKIEESAAVTTVLPTPTPTPTPTPVPLPTEDLMLKLDSFQMYQVNKGFLAEVKFTLKTNSGIEVLSINGSLDANLFKYDGYNFKTHKTKYHYEKFHQEFSMDTSFVTVESGPVSTEKQYLLMFNVPIDAISEDKFDVALTVSNTLNGEKTEDKTVTLDKVAIWDENTDSYAASMFDIKITHNADKSFDVTFTPRYDNVPITNPKIGGIYISAKKGTSYFTEKDLKVTYDGNTVHISFKKPKKAPSSGTISFGTNASFEVTDSTGTRFTDLCIGNFTQKF